MNSYKITGEKIIISEPLVDIEEIFELANKLKEIKTQSVVIEIENDYSLPSTIIGILRYLKDKGYSISIIVHSDLLYSLFSNMGLTDIFNVKKIEK